MNDQESLDFVSDGKVASMVLHIIGAIGILTLDPRRDRHGFLQADESHHETPIGYWRLFLPSSAVVWLQRWG